MVNCKLCGSDDGHYSKTCGAWILSKHLTKALNSYILSNRNFDRNNIDEPSPTANIKYWLSNIGKSQLDGIITSSIPSYLNLMGEWRRLVDDVTSGRKIANMKYARQVTHCKSAISKYTGMSRHTVRRGRVAGGKSKAVTEIQMAVESAKEVECPFDNKINSAEVLLARSYKTIGTLKARISKLKKNKKKGDKEHESLINKLVTEHKDLVNKLNGDIRLLQMANKSDDVCTICFEGVSKNTPNTTILGCGHPFHTNCIMEWVVGQNNNTCPNCKAPQEGASINDNIKCQWHGVPNCTDCYHSAMIYNEGLLDEEATQEVVDEAWVQPPAAQIIADFSDSESGSSWEEDVMPDLVEYTDNSSDDSILLDLEPSSPTSVSEVNFDNAITRITNRMLTYSQDSLDNAGIVSSLSV